MDMQELYQRYEEARWAYEQSLEKCQLVEDSVMAAHAIRGLAMIALQRGEFDKAEYLFHDALEGLQKIGDLNCASRVLQGQGELYRIQGDYVSSAAKLRSSLSGFQELGTEIPTCTVLEKFALLADTVGDYRNAIILLAFVDKIIGDLFKDAPTFKEEHQHITASGREHLGNDKFQQLWIEGKDLNLDSAIDLAMGLQVQ